MLLYRLQATQVDLLEYSFDQIKSHRLGFAADFYDTFFTDAPHIKPLFTESDISAQYDKLMNALVLVIQNLRTPETLAASLKGLGARHVNYGVQPEHYALMGRVLLKTLKNYLGSKWTAEIEQAWVDAYRAVMATMLEGADYSTSIFQISSGDATLAGSPPPMKPLALQFPARRSYGRPLSEILADLQQPLPVELAQVVQRSTADVKFIAWSVLAPLCDRVAPGWEGSVPQSGITGDLVVVTYRLTLHAAEGNFSRESLGTALLKTATDKQPFAKAEARAFINAVGRWGLVVDGVTGEG